MTPQECELFFEDFFIAVLEAITRLCQEEMVFNASKEDYESSIGNRLVSEKKIGIRKLFGQKNTILLIDSILKARLNDSENVTLAALMALSALIGVDDDTIAKTRATTRQKQCKLLS